MNQNFREKVEVVIMYNGKYGICLPSKEKPWHCLPGGGIDAGESLEVAAKRECLEEVGINIKHVIDLNMPSIFLGDVYGKGKNKGFDGGRTHYVLASYRSIDKSKYGNEGDARKIEWMTIEEAVSHFTDNVFDKARTAVLTHLAELDRLRANAQSNNVCSAALRNTVE